MAKKKVAILIDSSSTYDEKFNKANDIYVLPMQIIDNEGKSYNDDNKAINQKQIIDNLAKGKIYKSSVTSTGVVMQKVEELLEKYEEVVFFPIPFDISGQYQQAQNIVAPEFNGKLHVIKCSTGALLTEFAIHNFLSLLKKYDVKTCCEKITDFIDNDMNIYFFIKTLEGLIKGGRLSKVKGGIANLLGIKPVLSLEKGAIDKIGKTKNYDGAIKIMIDEFKSKHKGKKIKDIGILITATTPKDQIEKVLNTVVEKFGVQKKDIVIRFIPNVLFVHVWDGTFAIGAAFAK